ncbi:MAG: hypothetical protein Q8Q38_01550 [bacterium]|nr:hypothetical protein [bacterium]
MKLKERRKAIRLRRLGKSYGEILKYTPVSKGTLSLWLRDIEVNPKFLAELRGREISRYAGAKARQRQRIEKTELIIRDAKKEVWSLYRDPLFLAGLMLYWAEGDKSDENEQIKFTNSDPEMIRVMMCWFRKVCVVPEEKFRISLHVHELHCRSDMEDYWSRVTKVPLTQFHKTYIKQTSLRYRKNHLYNGTCAIRVSNRDLFRRMKGWRLAIVESESLRK